MLVAAALFGLSQVAQNSVLTAASASVPVVHKKPRGLRFKDGAVVFIPASAGPHPPLLVLLHGAGHRELDLVRHFADEAEERGLVLLAPSAQGATWDTVSIAEQPPSRDSSLANDRARRFTGSPDANRVEADIAELEKIVPADRTRTVLAGFSDGATFALAMGMSHNYDFAAVIAWSPGIAIKTAGPVKGRKVYVSHGREDPILRYQDTCVEIVPLLQREGAAVSFMPFEGGHDAPPPVKDAFLDAAFGPRGGAPSYALPATVEKCMPRSDDLMIMN